MPCGSPRRRRIPLTLVLLAKTPAGWFEPIMKSLALQSTAQLQADVAWAINLLPTHANTAHSQNRRKTAAWMGYLNI